MPPAVAARMSAMPPIAVSEIATSPANIAGSAIEAEYPDSARPPYPLAMSVPEANAGAEPGADAVTHEELVERLDRGDVLLLDVLPEESYQSGHIPGALHLPLDGMERRAPALLPDRDAELVVYCSGFT